MKRFLFLTIGLIAGLMISGSSTAAELNTLDDVHLFQGFFYDTPIQRCTFYGEAGFNYGDYDEFKRSFFGVQGGVPVNEQLEIGGRLGFVNLSPDVGDSEFGLSDFLVSCRYNFTRHVKPLPAGMQLAAGGFVTAPIGDEDAGEDRTDLGVYGAVRYPFPFGLVLSGVVGLSSLETHEHVVINRSGYRIEDDREMSLRLGAGALYPLVEKLTAVGELNIETEGDFALLTTGLDYDLTMGSRIRGGIGVGLDDGAPDFSLFISYMKNF